VREGPASQSYGLQVAALAGIPASVLKQARGHLALLEKQQRAETPQLGLFDQAEPLPTVMEQPVQPDLVRQRMEEIEPDTLTPREALALLYELKEL
jgi:DNA mismatch repair protein MutS